MTKRIAFGLLAAVVAAMLTGAFVRWLSADTSAAQRCHDRNGLIDDGGACWVSGREVAP